MIYLDYAANTPTDPTVLQRFCEVNQAFTGNPNARHAAGVLAQQKLAEITQSIAQLLHVLPQEIIYTSGASESNNLAIKGIAQSYRQTGRHILTTALEHASVSGALTALQEQGYEIELLPLTSNGTVDLEGLRDALRSDTVLVSIGYLDGEIGSIQPIGEIAQLVAQHPKAHLHVDATQAIGKIPVDFTGVHCVTLAPHKFYGLNGCGLLIKREGTVLQPLIHGGASTTLYRSGTPALALAASLEAALALALTNQPQWHQQIAALNEGLQKRLAALPYVRINSGKNAVPHILNISTKGVKADDMQRALSDSGICLSVKSACSVHGTPSRAVYALTKDKKNALHSFRISLSHLTTQNELDEFIAALDRCYKELSHG